MAGKARRHTSLVRFRMEDGSIIKARVQGRPFIVRSRIQRGMDRSVIKLDFDNIETGKTIYVYLKRVSAWQVLD